MFSGIVEECATLVAMVKDQENVHFIGCWSGKEHIWVN